jgi:hypothetical protein
MKVYRVISHRGNFVYKALDPFGCKILSAAVEHKNSLAHVINAVVHTISLSRQNDKRHLSVIIAQGLGKINTASILYKLLWRHMLPVAVT